MAFPRYLLRTAIAGLAFGGIHGASQGYRDLKHDVPVAALREPAHVVTYIVCPAARDALTWSLIGPWAPIALPIWLFYWKDIKCPLHPNPHKE